MDTLRKMHFFHPCIHVIGLQKCMTAIPGLLTIFKKNKQPCKCSGLILMIKTTTKKVTSVHKRNHLSLLWTCMCILDTNGS